MTVETRDVVTRDGLRLRVDDAGPPSAPAVIFVHGIAQDRTAFRHLLEGPLAAEVRCVAFDVRGHGDSDQPDDVDAYGARLGHDVDAVIRGLGLDRPVLAPWSYGGAIVGDYLRQYGEGQVGGVFLIAASVRIGRSAREYFGPGMMDHVRGLISPEQATYEAAARAFAAGCAVSASAATVEARVAAMLRVPAYVRRALLTRDEDFVAELESGTCPLAALHGAADQVVLPALTAHVHEHAPRTTVRVLPGVGHLPFVEAEADFRAALSAFVPR